MWVRFLGSDVGLRRAGELRRYVSRRLVKYVVRNMLWLPLTANGRVSRLIPAEMGKAGALSLIDTLFPEVAPRPRCHRGPKKRGQKLCRFIAISEWSLHVAGCDGFTAGKKTAPGCAVNGT